MGEQLLYSAGVERLISGLYTGAAAWLLQTGPRILLALVILFAGSWLIRTLRKHVQKKLKQKDVHASLQPFFIGLTSAGLYVALFFLVVEVTGIRLTIFAAVIAAFGAAAGLALSGTLQNFASGVLILLLKPFNVGDNIITQGFEGTVDSIQIFYTMITTYDNKNVVMPNSKLSNEVIINITQLGKRRLDLKIAVDLDKSFQQVKDILLKIFDSLDKIENVPPPRIGVSAIESDEYTVTANVWLSGHGFEDARLAIYAQVIEALHAIDAAKKKDEQAK